MPKKQNKPNNFVPPDTSVFVDFKEIDKLIDEVENPLDDCLLEKRVKGLVRKMPVWVESMARRVVLDFWTQAGDECVRFTVVFASTGWEYSWVVPIDAQIVATASEHALLVLINASSKSALHHISRLAVGDMDQL